MLPSTVITYYALCAMAKATQIFRNTGTTAGWDDFVIENKGSVQEVTNVVYKGSTALKSTQVYDPAWTKRYHAEAVMRDVYRKGDVGFYGFAFRLQEDWQFQVNTPPFFFFLFPLLFLIYVS